ncbi:MAG: hypothetical protein SWY16_00595 [Cyanobacteriota bacterium]|nr:hypothetical protein [Cyanobacteriota bacterium]
MILNFRWLLRVRPIALFVAALAIWSCAPNPPIQGQPPQEQPLDAAPEVERDPFDLAIERALEAWTLTQAARSPEDWDLVARTWIDAVALMQSVPPGDPKRAFAQKKVIEYLRNAAYAISRASEADVGFSYPTLNSPLLDEKLVLYQSYVRALGPADILIVGSSRAAQGIDPQMMQYVLGTQGYGGLKVFNFGIHGATAQVVDFLVRDLLPPEQLPKLILWVDGVRAFNSGREDRTYQEIVSSPGYQYLQNAKGLESRATLLASANAMAEVADLDPPLAAELLQGAIDLSANLVDANGFVAVSESFDPKTYYQVYPYVPGAFDRDYAAFNLGGVQATATESLAAYARARQIPLVVVNLPLTPDYLDGVRYQYEEEFRFYMQQLASTQGFFWRDLYGQGLDRYDYFQDPSHLNAAGAAAVARQIASDTSIPWPRR